MPLPQITEPQTTNPQANPRLANQEGASERRKPVPTIAPSPMEHVTEERARIAKSLTKFAIRIGVHSGKGGVGKTFVACGLARLLAENGDSVALLDADVDCPNVPESLALTERMTIDDAGLLQPVRAQGLEIVSTGFLQDDGEPLIIRGPIKHRILTDVVEKVAWRPHDFLIIDFTPGTSDVPLSAMQFIDLTGIILVTTPQRESLADVKRAAGMARKLNVPILGLVCNMEGEVFGHVSESFAAELGVPIITRIQLSKEIREACERGENAFEHSSLAAQRAALSKIVEHVN